MSGARLDSFLDYWESEGEALARHGDYDWMAALTPGCRVLEIGCGPGFSTLALVQRGLDVLVVDAQPACLALARQRAGEQSLALLEAEVTALGAGQREAILAFAPESVVCWLMGAPAEVTGASAGDGGKAVVAYRERVHRAVAELAADLPSVSALHLVDRTAIPWQAKDIGRATLLGYHRQKTLAGLPFQAQREDALYRKLEAAAPSFKPHAALKGVVPVLASLLAYRSS